MDAKCREDVLNRRKLQEEYQKAMQQTRQNNALKKQASECKSNFIKIRKELERIEAVVAALSHPKVFSPEMLGLGQPRGGNKQHRHNRYDVLERVRRLGGLIYYQQGQWEFLRRIGMRNRQLRMGQTGATYSRRVFIVSSSKCCMGRRMPSRSS